MIRCVLFLLLATGVGMMGLGDVAFAADPPPGQETHQAVNQSPAVAMPSTESFLASVAAGTLFEIDSSKLALGRTRSAAVKDFADRMVNEHSLIDARFKEAVSQAKLPPPTDKLDALHQAMLDALKARDAPSFDKAYAETQVQALRETVDLYRTYATVGGNARIKRFAQDELLTVRAHLDDARRLH
jgi:putative membrane protein